MKVLKKSFEIEHLVEEALDSLNDGDSIEEMLRWILLSAKAEEWLDNEHPNLRGGDKEYNWESNEVKVSNYITLKR